MGVGVRMKHKGKKNALLAKSVIKEASMPGITDLNKEMGHLSSIKAPQPKRVGGE